MTLVPARSAQRIADRMPSISGAEIVEHLHPPRQFEAATLDSYRPDPAYDSQAEAVDKIRAFAEVWTAPRGGLFSRKRGSSMKPGIYLDGGFGVGKTHLLAALWHVAPGRKYFGTFIEFTALVGAIGYRGAVDQLKGATLIAIDEFELDDPGDTMMMTRLLSDLVASGSRIAATSNTPPNALGEGRFAAADFLREIQALSDKFDTIRIDGLDYRRRDVEGHAIALTDADLAPATSALSEYTVDDFDGLLAHLATVHPSRYVKLIDGLAAVVVTGVHELTNQTDALRLVAFVDRLYDAQVRIFATGTPLDQVFGGDMLSGGYRKKYLRSVSRMIALTNGVTA